MNFEAIGEAWAMSKAIDNATKSAQSWIHWSTRQVAIARAEGEATEAGRLAQIHALRAALEAVAPDHPLLAETGLVHRSGRPEVRWQRAFYSPYDAIAIANSLPISGRAQAPWEHARQAVLEEPIEVRRILFCKTFWFRGEQHRSRVGAERARERAAESATLDMKRPCEKA